MNLSGLLKRRIPVQDFRKLKTISVFSKSLSLDPYLVGGAVRDLFLKVPFRQDMDITVNGGDVAPLAAALAKEWGAEFESYTRFLTFRINLSDGSHIDLVTSRREAYPHPAALPEVSKGTMETDLQRRDFSVNAMALSLSAERWGELLDIFEGYHDLRGKKIRVLHGASFQDDPTRIFRAARFAGRFGFGLEKETKALMEKSVRDGDIGKLSNDRIRVELEKIFSEKKPSAPLELLRQWGVLGQIDPKGDWNIRLLEKGGKGRLSAPLELLLCVLDHPENQVEKLLSNLNFPREFQDSVLQGHQFYRAFKEGKPAVSLARAELFSETRELFKILARSGKGAALKKWWGACRRWMSCRPVLDGEALKSMGYAPGPVFKEIMDALALARYEKRVKNRADEAAFVIDNFRRN